MVLTKEEALEMFRENKYKVELIGEKVPDGGTHCYIMCFVRFISNLTLLCRDLYCLSLWSTD